MGVELGSYDAAAGIATGSFDNGYNENPDPDDGHQDFDFRATVDGVTSPVVTATSDALDATITGDQDLTPGESTTISIQTNADWMDDGTVLYRSTRWPTTWSSSTRACR